MVATSLWETSQCINMNTRITDRYFIRYPKTHSSNPDVHSPHSHLHLGTNLEFDLPLSFILNDSFNLLESPEQLHLEFQSAVYRSLTQFLLIWDFKIKCSFFLYSLLFPLPLPPPPLYFLHHTINKDQEQGLPNTEQMLQGVKPQHTRYSLTALLTYSFIMKSHVAAACRDPELQEDKGKI